SGLRRGASHDAGWPRAFDHRVRVRHLRAGVHEPSGRARQCRSRRLFRSVALAHAAPARQLAKKGGGMRASRNWALDAVLLLTALLWLLPYLWMVLTSFKTLPEIVRHPTAPLPEGLSFEAYAAVLQTMPVAK